MNRFQKIAIICISLSLVFYGLFSLYSAIAPALPDRLDILRLIVPLNLRQDARLIVATGSFFLIVIAHAVYRRKERAWYATVVLLTFLLVSHLIKGLDIEEASLSLLLLILLFITRPVFNVKSASLSANQGLRTLFWMLAGSFLYSLLGLYWFRQRFHQPFSLQASTIETTRLLLGLNPHLGPWLPRHDLWFTNSVTATGFVALAIGLFSFLRPVILANQADQPELDAVRQLLNRYGTNALQQFALLGDKTFFFSQDGQAVIPFRLVGQVALALGDPIGPLPTTRRLIDQFLIESRKQDWRPAFFQLSEPYLTPFKKHGFAKLIVGQEAIIDLQTFSLDTPEAKELRNTKSRFERLGYQVEYIEPPASGLLLRALKTISDEWLSHQSGGEKTFSLGSFSYETLRQLPLSVVFDEHHDVIAFISLVPAPSGKSYMVDLMRRGDNTPNGAMEYLITEAALALQAAGQHELSLGLSPLSGLADSTRTTERTAHFIYGRFSRLYNFRGLHAFKQKFSPRWENRYLVYSTTLRLPQTVLSVIRANAGGTLRNYLSRRLFQPSRSN